MTDTILIVDDEPDLLRGLVRTVSMEIGCRVLSTASGARALEIIRNEPVDVILADIRMPEMDGLTLLQTVKKLDPAISVIIMTAYGSIEYAVEALKAGAYDFIQKPLDEDRLLHLLKKGVELNRLVRENARLVRKIRQMEPFEDMIGKSEPMLKVFSTIQMLARSEVTVLIRGETGTGKEMAARAIHRLSDRGQRDLVTVHCPAIPESILESELFGYRKGAFTGADRDQVGFFDQARGSTIFLDEIGDLPPGLQTKLLRVLQDKTVQPLGAGASHRVDVRIIAATNQDLEQRMAQNRFREDLYYRLNVASLVMPPLRRMREDIPLLVTHFLEKLAQEQNRPPKSISPQALDHLCHRDWPGNIRELENTLRGWCATTPGDVLTLDGTGDATDETSPQLNAGDLSLPYKVLKQETIRKFTLNYLHQLLAHTRGNVSLAAEISGIKRQSLQKIISRYGVDVEKYRC